MDVCPVSADWADGCPSFPVVVRDVTASRVVADMQWPSVRLVEKSVLDDHRSAVGDQAVPLHLSESETALSSTSLGWLTGEDLHAASASGVEFRAHEVVKSLVEDHSRENLRLEHFAGLAVDHGLSSGLVESMA